MYWIEFETDEGHFFVGCQKTYSDQMLEHRQHSKPMTKRQYGAVELYNWFADIPTSKLD